MNSQPRTAAAESASRSEAAEPPPLPTAVRAAAAARGFAAGNGYLTGQIVDRCA
jgi:hypothetical protein